MAFLGRFRITPSCPQGQGRNGALHGWLVLLDGKDEVGAAFFDEVLGDGFLGEERICGDDLSRDLDLIEQGTHAGDLIGFGVNLVSTFLG